MKVRSRTSYLFFKYWLLEQICHWQSNWSRKN